MSVSSRNSPTSRRKKTKIVASPEQVVADDRKAEIIRRALLCVVTVLLVARPLVLGEDPGLRDSLSGVSGLVVSMLWLVLAAAWAGWRAFFKQSTRLVGPIEGGLAVVVALVFLSSFAAAHYKHAALLIAWEWLILLLAFSLIRQLARPEDVRGLLAVLVASAVSISVHAIYQATVELPRQRAALSDPDSLRAALATLPVPVLLAPDDPQLEFWKKRIEMDHAFATFAHPNSFAGFLALLFPIALGWGFASRRLIGDVRIYLAFGCAAIVAVALWLTHSRGAILGTLIAGSGALALYYRDAWWRWKVWVLGGAAGLALILFAASRTHIGAEALNKATDSFSVRAEYWKATWSMIGDHPWLGVGPGNFGRHYPRYMAPTATEKVQEPHNFVLEMWSSCGLFAALALLAALGLSFHRSIRDWFVAIPKHHEDFPALSTRGTSSVNSPRWDLYLGGMMGLVVGFVFRAAELSQDAIATEAILSAVRSVVWFGTFALLESISWTGRTRTLALATGVAALLLNLCISDGISWPSVAQPLWAVAALAILSAQYSVSDPPNSKKFGPRFPLLARFLPLPILAGLAAAYLLLVFTPVTQSVADQSLARIHYGDDPRLRGWNNAVKPRWAEQMTNGQSAAKEHATAQAGKYLADNILKPLLSAQRADPGDSTPLVQLSHWYLEEWRLFVNSEKGAPLAGELQKHALGNARRAQALDPDNKDGYRSEYQVYVEMAERDINRADVYLSYAVKALNRIVDLDPTEARLRYELADILFKTKNRVDARRQAEKALELDRLARSPERQLNNAQRAQAGKWLNGAAVPP